MIPEWLTLSNNSGSGDSIVTITASSYNELTARTASLTVSGHTKSVNIGVLQEGTGVWSVSPDYMPMTIQGGSIYLDIVSPYDNWYIVNNLSWITFNQLSGAPGSYSIEMTIDQNSNPYGRNGSFTVTDGNNTTEVTVEQDGTGEMSIYPTSFSFGNTGGTASFTVTAYTNWNVSVLPLWLHLSQETGTTGVTVVTMTADTNSSSARTVTFEVDALFNHVDITVTQAENVLNVSPTAFTFVASGEAKTFTVETYADYWEITNYPAWVSFSQTDGGPGIATVTVSAETNTGVIRNSSFDVSDGYNTVSCDISQEEKEFTVSPRIIIFPYLASTSTLVIDGPSSWFINKNDQWINFSSMSGIGHTLVTVSANTNTGSTARNADFTVEDSQHTTISCSIGQTASGDTPGQTEYLTFDVLTPGLLCWYSNSESVYSGDTIEYRVNNGAWHSVTATRTTAGIPGAVIGEFQSGDTIEFRGENSKYQEGKFRSVGDSQHAQYDPTEMNINIRGNIMSLIYGDNFVGKTFTDTNSGAFIELFLGLNVINANNLVLPSNTVDSCYDNLFSRCFNLITPPELPATTAEERSYVGMFKYCSALTYAPALPATTVKRSCYADMFQGCTSLTTAPALMPATTLNDLCYSYMFAGCTSLTTAPELPATILNYGSYEAMFSGCTSLNYVKCLATTISARYCTTNWLKNVSPTGTFVKDSLMTGWTTGDNGIPSGWTVQDA